MSKVTLTAMEVDRLGIALNGIIAKEFPPGTFKLNYALAKLSKEVERELKLLMELRQKLVKTYVLHDEKGQELSEKDPKTGQDVYSFKNDETKEIYLKELKDISNMPVEIDHLTVPYELMEKISINPFQTGAIMFMIEEEK